LLPLSLLLLLLLVLLVLLVSMLFSTRGAVLMGGAVEGGWEGRGWGG
jgi:hypothetical protein